MRPRPLLLTLVALVGGSLLVPAAAMGQSFAYAQECITNVDNATVHVPASAAPTLPDGTPVAAGDTLAVYTDQGACAGYGVWRDGEGTTFAAAGADSITVSEGGYAAGDSLRFEVFDVSAGQAVDIGANVAFASCDSVGVPVCGMGAYEKGTLHQVSNFQDTASLTRTLPLADGWNFISIPVQTNLPFEDLLPACSSGFFYTPGEGYTTIGSDETIPVGTGVVVQCEADTTSVTGPPAAPTIEVEEGWNLIGSVEDTVAVDAVTTSPTGILASDFFRLPPGQGYQPATELRPGEGYWVKTTEAGTLDVSGGSAPLAEASNDALDGTSRLSLVDASGQTSTLWLKTELGEEQRRRFERPPVPPEEVFDVRFANGYAAAAIAPDEGSGGSGTRHRVQMQGVDFPVEVRLEANGTDRRFRLSAGEDEFTLSSDQSSVRIQQSIERFAVAAASAPSAFELGKVFPNPLRAQARMKYALPEEAEVSIVVYDVLGRRVARLVGGRREAGVHRTQMDADRLASGKYFVRMRAGSFQETRQLTVVR